MISKTALVIGAVVVLALVGAWYVYRMKVESEVGKIFDEALFNTEASKGVKEGLHGGGGHGGGGHGWGGGGRGGWGGGRLGRGGWGGAGWGGGRHWGLTRRAGFRRPGWWGRSYYGRPWWWWWYYNPAQANQWVVGQPGYCEWCATCDNFDPNASTSFCAGCAANCSLRPYGP